MRLVDSSAAAASDYDERVRNGHEPLFETGVQERVVRLAGRESDVTELSVRRFGAHIVPVFEDFSLPSVRRTLAAARTAGSGVDTPFGWHVPDGAYSKMESWGVPPPTVDRDGDGTADYDLSRAAFRVKREWLLPNGPGKRALVVEADSSVGEQALALGAEGADDLTLQECSQGFRLVERLATEQKALQEDDAVIRVMLADASRQIRSGGGAAMSLRALVEEHDEADIIIDASAPLIHSIVTWAETTGSGRHLLFKTENSEYYASVRSSLKARGWRVADFEGRLDEAAEVVTRLSLRGDHRGLREFHRKSAAEERGRRGTSLRFAGQRVGRRRAAAARVAVASSSIGVARLQRGDLLRLFYARAPRDSSGDAHADDTEGARRRVRSAPAGLIPSFIPLRTTSSSFSSSSFRNQSRRRDTTHRRRP